MSAQATNAEDDAAIRSTLASYNDALNRGKTAAVLPLYTHDRVFMPPYSQSAVGKDARGKSLRHRLQRAEIPCEVHYRRTDGDGSYPGLCPHELGGDDRPSFDGQNNSGS
jgi:ketosteroid isomerase-like protein